MTKATTTYVNEYYRKKREELVKKFGGCCRYCGRKEWMVNIKTGNNILLEFAHKVGHRISGNNRGRNQRILEVLRHPEWFLLLCHSCHLKYDIDHPLTEEEQRLQAEELANEVPF